MYASPNADNLTTIACGLASLAGMFYYRRKGMYYQGWAIAFGVTLGLDILARRESDNLTMPSTVSTY